MSASEPSRTPTGRALWRGITRRCAYCGSGHLFHRWFTMAERCPGCGLRFRRLEGHWSGDIGINTVVTFALLWFVLLGGTLAMWGHVNYVALGIAAAFVAIVFPIIFVPFAKTLWVAIDVIMRPVQPDELDPEPTAQAGHLADEKVTKVKTAKGKTAKGTTAKGKEGTSRAT